MNFSEEYHYFFDNHGRCPECKKMLIMSFGCINFNCEIARRHICTYKEEDKGHGRQYRLSLMMGILKYYLFAFEKEDYFEKIKLYKLKNLDKQPKKQYIKIDDSGISE